VRIFVLGGFLYVLCCVVWAWVSVCVACTLFWGEGSGCVPVGASSLSVTVIKYTGYGSVEGYRLASCQIEDL